MLNEADIDADVKREEERVLYHPLPNATLRAENLFKVKSSTIISHCYIQRFRNDFFLDLSWQENSSSQQLMFCCGTWRVFWAFGSERRWKDNHFQGIVVVFIIHHP